MAATTTHDGLSALEQGLAGRVLRPDTPEYDEARTLFNSMIDRRPGLIAQCTTPEDVALALAFGRRHGLEIAVRSGGHSVAGMSLCDGGLVLDVRPMDSIQVDAERRLVRVGGGCTWAAVDRATQEHGLATTGGRVSSTGVAGLTLGGGSGWLERQYGLACDNLVSVELVTADGTAVTASADEHPELFWALHGGGGNFGVATALTFRLHPVGPEVLGYWFPEDGKGTIGNDMIAVLKSAKNPVLAHHFLNYLLDEKHGYDNFVNFVGYQPPFVSIDPDRLVTDEVVPANLKSAVVRENDFIKGNQPLELSPEGQTLWQNAWAEFKAGA